MLLAGYLVLCGTVCQSVMLPNTYVNGRDISGLTLEEATQVVQDTFSQDYASIGLTVAAEGKEYGVDLTGALDLNASRARRVFYPGDGVDTLPPEGQRQKRVAPRSR